MKKIILILTLLYGFAFGQNKKVLATNCGTVKKTDAIKITKTKMKDHGKNVLGTDLELASLKLLTGFYRDGFCSTGFDDKGIHVVAAIMTKEFLKFSKSHRNDLITQNLDYDFPGLKPGDTWCLCILRWKDAFKAGVAPPVILNATHFKALEFVTIEDLKKRF